MKFLIQASSKTWAGSREYCLLELDGFPAIYWTIKRIYDNFEEAEVMIIAPEYDAGGMDHLRVYFKNLSITYSHDASPLSRMVDAVSDLSAGEYVVRMNALNFLFDIELIQNLYDQAVTDSLDCVKAPDDYPVYFTGDVYRVSSLETIKNHLESVIGKDTQKHEIHPSFFAMKCTELKTRYVMPQKEIKEDEVSVYNAKMSQVIYEERQHVKGAGNAIPAGDQLSFHYQLALNYLQETKRVNGKILDIACGPGFGIKMLSGRGYSLVGADYDKKTIEDCTNFYDLEDTEFVTEDVTNITYDDNVFDVVLSMETLEHVRDPKKMLSEIQRVLKPNGLLILSTPQNSYSGKPICPEHIYEYSLQELTEMMELYFNIEKVIGLKAGTIYFDEDPIGQNSVFFVSK
ncbi:MAG: class I SAM-dependent methyltransferase [Fibrobacterales bacterium]